MKNYKGYYIDKVIFNSKADIDQFLKDQAVEAYKKAVEYFTTHPTMEASLYCHSKAEILVNQCGYTWEQVEALEIATFEATA